MYRTFGKRLLDLALTIPALIAWPAFHDPQVPHYDQRSRCSG
jgi:hypothetical protein